MIRGSGRAHFQILIWSSGGRLGKWVNVGGGPSRQGNNRQMQGKSLFEFRSRILISTVSHHLRSSLASPPSWTLRSSSYSVYSTLNSFAFSPLRFVSATGMRCRCLHGNCLWISCNTNWICWPKGRPPSWCKAQDSTSCRYKRGIMQNQTFQCRECMCVGGCSSHPPRDK
jgi:hypothetical protein